MNNLTRKQRKMLYRILLAAALLIAVKLLPHLFPVPVWMAVPLYLAPYLIIGWDVLWKAVRNILNGQVFDENFLMALATVGAFATGEYAEAVFVMLFYQTGELFQDYAVGKSRQSIAALMDIRPDTANLELEDGSLEEVDPEDVEVGAVVVVRPGERVPLDGEVLEGASALDTAALTGESVPRDVEPGDDVISGCVNQSGLLRVRVTRPCQESTVSKILDLVENAGEKKAASENFITRFARYYTPCVTLAALALFLIPTAALAVVPAAAQPTFLAGTVWTGWLHRALIFLVISCPCALVISVPLSFFAGIGRASREGVLVKGGNHLETLAEAQIVAFDKTGTLTEGRFSVSQCRPAEGISQERLLELAALAECRSTHPIAQSILAAWGGQVDEAKLSDYQETSGHGVAVTVDGQRIIAGKRNYLTELGISLPEMPDTAATAVYTALDGVYQGVILLRDAPKEDAKGAISALRELGVDRTAMLSGDSAPVVEEIAREIGLDQAVGGLLPQDKLTELEKLRSQLTGKGRLLYAGDGINDTPVLAAADIGIAMGGLGADAAIETADVIIMGDEPSKIASGIRIARRTNRIATENIVFAIAVKLLVMILSVLGHIELWAGVFADVGVCMLCVLNTLRINKK